MFPVEGSVCWAASKPYIALRSIVAQSTRRHSDGEWQAGPSQAAFCVAAWLHCLDLGFLDQASIGRSIHRAFRGCRKQRRNEQYSTYDNTLGELGVLMVRMNQNDVDDENENEMELLVPTGIQIKTR